MGGYIRLDKKQVEDPRLFTAAAELAKRWKLVIPATPEQPAAELPRIITASLMRNALLGALAALWSYADTHIYADDSLRVTLDALADTVGLPVEFLQALPFDWLRVRSDGMVELPSYCAKNHVRGKDLRKQDLEAKKAHERQLNAERQQRHRDKKRQQRGNGVTLDSKRDSNGVTGHPGPGPVPLTPTGTGPKRAAARSGSEGPAPPREEAPEVTEQRRKLRGVVAGLRTAKAIKPA